jgi:circadian clock protein KaiC
MVTAIKDITSPPNRMRTGIAGLDQILGGGFLHGNSILIQGTPGAGKSALGLEIIANGILLFNEPGIIFSFEQYPQLLYRDARNFGWDLRAMEEQGLLRVLFAHRDDLYSSFAEIESDAITHLTEGAIDLVARRAFIDGASNFWRLPLSLEEQRKIFFEFVMKLKGLGVTPILASDLSPCEEEIAPEEFAVDTIVRLEHRGSQLLGDQRRRTIEIAKARGQQCIDGKHPLRIQADGVHVSPYVQLPASTGEAVPEEPGRCSTGVADLDALLKGGVLCRSTTMLAGMTGTGKTTLAAYFLAAGLSGGEPAIFVSFNERPAQLLRNMEQRELAFAQAASSGALTVVHAATPGQQLIEFYHQLDQLVDATKARRVVIDGLRDLMTLATNVNECEYFISLFKDLFYRNAITSIFTCQVEEVSGLSSLASIPHTSMMDNIFYLGVVELESKLRRVLAVFKTRGELTDNALRELILTPTQVRISSLMTGVSGILMGSATGHLTESGREVIEPLLHIREFLNNAQVDTPDQARYVVDNLRQEFNLLATKLSEHFEFPPGV